MYWGPAAVSEVDALLERLVAQFAGPYDFLRELVQNALDAGSDRAEVVLETHTDPTDRAWRFGLRAPASETAQARFECDACHRHFQLPQASEPTKAAADQILNALSTLGHQGQRVDLSIHGTCAGCIEPSQPR